MDNPLKGVNDWRRMFLGIIRLYCDLNRILMYKYHLMIMMVAATFAKEYFLSPILPPTAYYGQYYTVHFRVIGMDNPTFSFDNLPSCFTSRSDGTIEGKPDAIGSFAVRVNFVSNQEGSSQDIVFRVVQSFNSFNQTNNQVDTESKERFTVVSQQTDFVYFLSDSISFCLIAINGKEPFTWNYINLPSHLIGNTKGCISGVFEHQGYYSFLISVSDSLGSTADSYFTLNIQPKSALGAKSLSQVSNMISFKYDLQLIEDQQIAATNTLFQCIHALYKTQDETDQCRITLDKTTKALNQANNQALASEENSKNKRQIRNKVAVELEKAFNAKTNAQNRLSLAKSNYQNAQSTVRYLYQSIQQIQKATNTSKNVYFQASNAFIFAQTESSQASAALKMELSTDMNARNDYNLAFSTLSNRKQDLQAAQDQRDKSDSFVVNSSNIVNIVRKLNDDALSRLAEIQQVLERAGQELKDANQVVSLLQKNLSDAADMFGTAKFNLQQAINTLFVAQARKQQADKATQLVRLQTSSQASLFIFAGCEQYAYPTICGSAKILRIIENGFELSSGHQLIYGNCTSIDKGVLAGDIINYKGYIKDGFIHSLDYKKNGIFPL